MDFPPKFTLDILLFVIAGFLSMLGLCMIYWKFLGGFWPYAWEEEDHTLRHRYGAAFLLASVAVWTIFILRL